MHKISTQNLLTLLQSRNESWTMGPSLSHYGNFVKRMHIGGSRLHSYLDPPYIRSHGNRLFRIGCVKSSYRSRNNLTYFLPQFYFHHRSVEKLHRNRLSNQKTRAEIYGFNSTITDDISLHK